MCVKSWFNGLQQTGEMTSTEQERASEQINVLAGRNSWPLIGDPLLRFATPQLKSVHEVWEAKRGARTMPARGDLTMSDLKMVLPNLAFLSIVRDDARTRFKAKLMGSDVDKFMGGAMTGRFLDEVVPKRFVDKWVALWTPALEARVPTRTVGRVEFADQRFYVSETFHAPLADDGETPDVLMLVSYFHFINDEAERGKALANRLMAEVGDRAALGGMRTFASTG